MGLLQEKLAKYDLPQQYMAMGVYPYFREIEGKQGTEVNMGGHNVLMFGSNAYTGLTGDERVIAAGIEAMKKIWFRLCRFSLLEWYTRLACEVGKRIGCFCW